MYYTFKRMIVTCNIESIRMFFFVKKGIKAVLAGEVLTCTELWDAFNM